MVLTNNAFLDSKMARWYWENDRKLVEAREYVDEVLNCEDILMNCKCQTHPDQLGCRKGLKSAGQLQS